MRSNLLLCPTAPVLASRQVQALSRFQYTALELIIGTSTKLDQLAAEILCGLPPMQLQNDIIFTKPKIKHSQQLEILWKLYNVANSIKTASKMY